ncbi:MAG: TRAP transporter large permease [Lachnospiraceae bacterium]|nr:TRAP transporter large permease [Lachnospiraceae bacterium]
MTLICMVVFFILLFLGTPIAFALGLGAVAGILHSDFLDLITLPQKMLGGINSFSMIAVPLYIMAGNLCGETGLAKRLVRFCSSLVGHIPGGTGLVNVLASMFFGGISGSAVADTAAIGGMLIPAMEEEGYDAEFAGGITCASSTIGILIPPSIPQCLYALTAGVSIGAMFMAGLIPGLFVGFAQMVIAWFISKKKGYPCHPKASRQERWQAFKESALSLVLPLIILLGSGLGIATATEVGCVAVLYALFLGLFVYKEFKLRDLPGLIIRSAKTTAVALLTVAVATTVSYIINMEQIPAMIVQFFETYCNSLPLILILINLVLFLVGCVMDLVPAMLLFAPIFLPVVEAYGMSAIQFGCMMTVNLGIGLCTPPVGNCLFIASGIAERDIFKLFKAALPFLACNVASLVLCCVWEPFTTFIPHLLGYI